MMILYIIVRDNWKMFAKAKTVARLFIDYVEFQWNFMATSKPYSNCLLCIIDGSYGLVWRDSVTRFSLLVFFLNRGLKQTHLPTSLHNFILLALCTVRKFTYCIADFSLDCCSNAFYKGRKCGTFYLRYAKLTLCYKRRIKTHAGRGLKILSFWPPKSRVAGPGGKKGFLF
jgi:hypothetical protein